DDRFICAGLLVPLGTQTSTPSLRGHTAHKPYHPSAGVLATDSLMHCPVSMDHVLDVPLAVTVRTLVPLFRNITSRTPLSCGAKVLISLPVVTSHILAVLSSAPVTTFVPSASNAHTLSPAVWP